ncbi:MAG: SIS domain-containing protein [Gammaproteobacteria bacterium]|nr:SIS domain-containing protein [Gammaproteobacteria bacterium]
MTGFGARLTAIADLMQSLQQPRIFQGIDAAIQMLVTAVNDHKPILICGNGGSASDALHISGELVGRFLIERRALDVVCLNANVSVLTAWSNDYDYASVFARQVEAHGRAGGILWGLSTSGNSANVVAAFETARSLGMHTLALTGEGGGRLAGLADILIDVPSRETPRIQELHLPIYHFICEAIEQGTR